MGMQATVGGVTIDVEQFLVALVSKDIGATKLLVSQLQTDVAAGGSNSVGLLMLAKAFREKTLRHLRAKHFPSDPDTADEAWNDTLVRVLQRIDGYDESKSAFTTWLFNQANYAALDLRRTLARRREQPVPSEAFPDEVDVSQEMPEPLTVKERVAFKKAWDMLTDQERSMLSLRYVEGYRHVEIARGQLAGALPEEHVRVYVNRAARRLRELYEKEVQS